MKARLKQSGELGTNGKKSKAPGWTDGSVLTLSHYHKRSHFAVGDSLVDGSDHFNADEVCLSGQHSG